jgi:hypothetical protein
MHIAQAISTQHERVILSNYLLCRGNASSVRASITHCIVDVCVVHAWFKLDISKAYMFLQLLIYAVV